MFLPSGTAWSTVMDQPQHDNQKARSRSHGGVHIVVIGGGQMGLSLGYDPRRAGRIS